MRSLLSILVLITATAALAQGAVTASDFAYADYSAGGVDVPYRLYTPPGMQAGVKYPLILFLHGAGEKGTDNNLQLAYNCQGAFNFLSDANQAKQKCLFMAPQSWATDWSDPQMQTNLATIIQQLIASASVDANRVYVTGISMGGGGTWQCLASNPDVFAAAIPQSGWGCGNYAAFKDKPLWCFHAANDGTVGVGAEDGPINELRFLGGNPIYTRYDGGGHGIWQTAYATPGLFDWLIAQRRGVRANAAPLVAFTSPTNGTSFTTSQSYVTFTGTATSSGAISSITYQFGETWDAAFQTGTAAGASAWSFGISMPAVSTTLNLRAMAIGTSWSSLGGNTTYSASMSVTRQNGVSDTVAPAITITGPTSATSATSSSATYAISGSASDNVGVTGITWSNNRGGSGTAAGYGSWSVTGISLQGGANVITVTATDAAGNTASDAITVTWNAPDTIAPAVTITSPTSATSFNASAASIALGGTASDNMGVTSIGWSNDRGGSGSASGTNTWSVGSIALQNGVNVITVSARDVAGNSGSDSISVTWNPPTTPPVAGATFRAEYYPTNNLTGSPVLASTASVFFDWGFGSPAGMPNDNFSARWSGSATPTATGTYTFFAAGDDGIRLWVNGSLVIDAWYPQGEREYAAAIPVIAGVPVSIRFEYFELGGSAVAKLSWSGPTQAKQPIPASAGTPVTTVAYRALIDFGAWSKQTPGFTNVFDETVVPVVSDTGASTGARVVITDSFVSVNENGVVAHDLYPGTAQSDTLYVDAVNNPYAEVQLQSLNPGMTYDVTLFASRGGVNDDRSKVYTVGGSSQVLNAANNTNRVVRFVGIRAGADGIIRIGVAAAAGSPYGYLGVVELIAHAPVGNG